MGTILQTSTTVQPATDTVNIPLAPLVITITNQNGGGSGAFVVNGNIAVTRSDTSGFLSTFVPGSVNPPSLTVPEPSSFAMVGLAFASLALARRRRFSR
ncbi:PEP-CTERM sorting domain-containing protein [Luteitalea pratensis]|uniref:PEP-CTERM sorting domain-containing protein n=1 Tax=Luteitalea pratensis TaxID=1855912 RepID=UPI0012FFB53B|nr:PEP-CTERM sorting domain-containing protein [Luteitalea pratensis]